MEEVKLKHGPNMTGIVRFSRTEHALLSIKNLDKQYKMLDSEVPLDVQLSGIKYQPVIQTMPSQLNPMQYPSKFINTNLFSVSWNVLSWHDANAASTIS